MRALGWRALPRSVLRFPRKDKRLLVIIETDGCFADGIEAASGCTIRHRTLRIEDYGKIAATFINVLTGQAVRLAPRLDIRQRVYDYATGETRHYLAQLLADQIMPDVKLLAIQSVQLKIPVEKLVSRAGVRVNFETCGKEIINERETIVDERVLCQACAFGGYYQPAAVEICLPTSHLCFF